MTEDLQALRTSKFKKALLFFYFSVVIIIIFIHYPFGRYHSTKEVSVVRGEGECPKSNGIEEIKAMTAEQLRQSVLCRQVYQETVDMPILDWYSEESLIGWFYSLSHTLSLLGLVTLVSGGAALIFGNTDRKGSRSDA
jgi:hypothetical protein